MELALLGTRYLSGEIESMDDEFDSERRGVGRGEGFGSRVEVEL